MRCGEIGGLQWSDIDLNSGFLYVKRTLLQDSKKGGFYYGIPKSKSSKRKVPLTDEAKNILLDQQKLQYKLKHQSSEWHNEWNDLVFSTINGNPVGASTFRITMIRIVKNINKDREADALGGEYEIFRTLLYAFIIRHTFATRCIEKEANQKHCKRYLGIHLFKLQWICYVHVSR
ncbi:MAG: tyrosine-type recombinase/integrase [Roseburia inulinivorans]